MIHRQADRTKADEIFEQVSRMLVGDTRTKEIWKPNPSHEGKPNPQKLAYDSLADELFYGGAAGGGKTDLLLGLAGTRHQRSSIFRRVYPSMAAMIDRSAQIFEQHGQYN